MNYEHLEKMPVTMILGIDDESYSIECVVAVIEYDVGLTITATNNDMNNLEEIDYDLVDLRNVDMLCLNGSLSPHEESRNYDIAFNLAVEYIESDVINANEFLKACGASYGSVDCAFK